MARFQVVETLAGPVATPQTTGDENQTAFTFM
jgi:hypothetical protein